MTIRRLAGVALLCLSASAVASSGVDANPTGDEAAAVGGEAPLFRIFLKNGATLVSYGEFARVADRVVFSMPVSAAIENPQLHLVDIASERVDWARTVSYAESARAHRYAATRGETDYAALTGEIAQALNDVAKTSDPARRLAIVERARKTLVEWPARHYNYKQADVRQMVAMLDEAIANLRAASGAQRFDLTLVASVEAAPAAEPLLAAPTAQEVIEQTLAAAALTDTAAERTSLLAVALASIDREIAELPAAWAGTTRAATAAAIDRELEKDRAYRSLQVRMLRLAGERARAADVHGIQQLLAETNTADRVLGGVRPDTVNAIIAVVQEQLDAARRLRLERDRWSLRLPAMRHYRQSVGTSIQRLANLRPALEDIKALAGSGPDALGAILKVTADVLRIAQAIKPPDECREMHGLLMSAAQLADAAARLRREAALTGDMRRAWDASSAAAGSLMLAERTQTELQTVLRPPQLPR
jgi:hypothetical protein